MIATITEIKTLLQITDTDSDALITELIPLIQEDILVFLKNKFIIRDIEYKSKYISFSGNTITDSQSSFVTSGFVDGNIVIQDSKLNNGFYTVTNVTAGALTVSEDLIIESAENDIKINQVMFPKALKMVMSNMIGFSLAVKHGVKSESISRYSVTYANDGQNLINGYPDTIVKSLTKWRLPYNDY